MKWKNAGVHLPKSFADKLNTAIEDHKAKTGETVNFRQLTYVMVLHAVGAKYRAVPKTASVDNVPLSYGVTEELAKRITEYCKEHGITKTQFVASALSRPIKRDTLKEAGALCKQVEPSKMTSFRLTETDERMLESAAAALSISKTEVIARGLQLVHENLEPAAKAKGTKKAKAKRK